MRINAGFFDDSTAGATLTGMAAELTLRDVMNHMSNGFAQFNERLDRIEGRMGRIDDGLTGMKSELAGIKRQLQQINDCLEAIENILSRHRKTSVPRRRSRAGIAAIDRPGAHVRIAA